MNCWGFAAVAKQSQVIVDVVLHYNIYIYMHFYGLD